MSKNLNVYQIVISEKFHAVYVTAFNAGEAVRSYLQQNLPETADLDPAKEITLTIKRSE